MKKYIYILSALVSIISFTSCEVEFSEKGYYKTKQGRIALSKIENTLNDYIYITEIIGKVDLYAEAEEENKEGIRTFYFPQYEISKTANTWTLKNSKTEWVLTHNNKSINEAGATWSVKLTKNMEDKNSVVVSGNEFQLKSLGNKNWSLQTSDMMYGIAGLFANEDYNYYHSPLDSTKTSSELQVTASLANNKSPNLYNYKLNSGSGKAVSTLTMAYKIDKPLDYIFLLNYNQLLLATGILSITVSDDKNRMDKVKAVIELNDGRINREITFNGITEKW